MRATALILLGSLPTSAAWAKAGSEPAADAMLHAAPVRLALRFNEPVRVLALGLVGPAGTAEALADVAAADGLVTARPAGPLAPGTHVLSWRIASADGHPVAGTLVFAIGHAGGVARADTASDGAVAALLWAARLALAASLALAAGGSFAAALLPGLRPPRRAAWLGLAAMPAVIGLHGCDALGIGLSGLADPAAWATGAATGQGLVAAFAVPALLAAPLAAGAFAATGHAANAPPAWLMRPVLFVHLACVLAWAGALLPLRRALRTDPPAAAALLPALSAALLPAFLLLAATGAGLAWVQLGTPAALWTTGYGAVLSAKLAVVLSIAALAAWNRRRLTPALLRAPAAAAPRLARSVALELGLALLVLAAAGLWRFTPPPRALAQRPPLGLHIHDPRVMATLTVTPGRAGANDVAVVLQGADFSAFAAKEVTLGLAQPGAGIAPITRKARRGEDGVWRLDALPLVAPGTWQVTLDVLVNDFEQVTLEDAMEVPR